MYVYLQRMIRVNVGYIIQPLQLPRANPIESVIFKLTVVPFCHFTFRILNTPSFKNT